MVPFLAQPVYSAVQRCCTYTVFHKKDPFLFFIIYSNYEQFTRNFLPVVAEEILIRNI